MRSAPHVLVPVTVPSSRITAVKSGLLYRPVMCSVKLHGCGNASAAGRIAITAAPTARLPPATLPLPDPGTALASGAEAPTSKDPATTTTATVSDALLHPLNVITSEGRVTQTRDNSS